MPMQAYGNLDSGFLTTMVAGDKGVAVTTEWTTVLGPIDVLAWPYRVVTVHNIGPGVVADGVEEARPDDDPEIPWESLDTITFTNLAVGAIKSYVVTDAYRYIRVRLRGATDTQVNVYVTANR